jgi:hypothetical protein
MNPDDLREEIAIELEAMEQIVEELLTLQHDVARRMPTVREKTAGAGFLAQFYNGLENILKRISLHHNVALPVSPNWHVELFQRFAAPHPDLPHLFDDKLASDLAPYRRFRHVVLHSYGFQLDWSRMAEGISNIQNVFEQFKINLHNYLHNIA